MRLATGIFFVALFFGAMLWAKKDDPFARDWFALRTADAESLKCVSVLPKPVCKIPVVIFAHGPQDNFGVDGMELRQMAELGGAAVGIESDQTNQAAFDEQVFALENYLEKLPWVLSNSVALIGSGLGAERMLGFAATHPEARSQLMVVFSDAPEINRLLSTNAFQGIPILWVHGDNLITRTISPKGAREKMLASPGSGLVIEKVLPGATGDFGVERTLVMRLVGEYCKATLMPNEPFRGVPERWVAPFWVWELPALAWAAFCIWRWWQREKTTRLEDPESRLAAAQPLKTWEKGLRVAAVVLATVAIAETGVHLVTPQLAAGERTLRIARKWLIAPKMEGDFELAAADGVWRAKPLKWLLDNVELSHYNRNELINWKIDETIYREFVLPPEIGASTDGELNWRRPLWESFYPRVRKENSPEDAARIVVRFLRERVTIDRDFHPTGGIVTAWERGITDVPGFERIYVAALRSVGVGARLDANDRAEFWTGKAWTAAPRPIAETFL